MNKMKKKEMKKKVIRILLKIMRLYITSEKVHCAHPARECNSIIDLVAYMLNVKDICEVVRSFKKITINCEYFFSQRQ